MPNCKNCGNPIQQQRAGRPRLYCHECNPPALEGVKYAKRVRQCVDCPATFTGQGTSERCQQCRVKRRVERKKTAGTRTRATWYEKAREMRAQGCSVRVIAREVGVTVQRVCQLLPGKIDHLIRQPVKFNFKCPQCGMGMRKDRDLCARCTPVVRDRDKIKEYRKKRVADLLERGLCTYCGKRPLITKKACVECTERNRMKTFQNLHEKNPSMGYYKIVDGKRVRVEKLP